MGEQSNAIAIDPDGNAYVTGKTVSTDFPITTNAFQKTNTNSFRGTAFVTKLDPTGSALVYSTYLGGGNAEQGFGIAADPSGSAYVAGFTRSRDFPVTAGAFQGALASPFPNGSDAFVTKLTPDGSALVYSTYVGGTANDFGGAIAVDSGGNAYITGRTEGDFPVTAGAFQSAFGGEGPGTTNAFVAKLNPAGSGLVYSTYLGGSCCDQGSAIAVDANGNAYVVGAATSSNFPTTPGAFQPAHPFGQDAFVAKLDPAGATLVYSTFLGGTGADSASGVAVDEDGNATVTGTTSSTDFPTQSAFQPTIGSSGSSDAFVTRLKADGSALFYSSYLGGSDVDGGLGIALDAAGNAYVSGQTRSTDFPTTPGALQPIRGGIPGSSANSDAFVTKIDRRGKD